MRHGILIKDGRVIDPGNMDAVRDILILDGKIEVIATPGTKLPLLTEIQVVAAKGKIVTPGLIDMHVHLREPGFEYKETIGTGRRAASCGGFTAVCSMPNTQPVCDRKSVVEKIKNKAAGMGVDVYPVAAISRNLAGKALCDFVELKAAGAIAVSDDGNPVVDNQLMRHALEQAGKAGLPVISHCEYPDLVAGGSMNEGELASRMGRRGIPNAAESIMVMRDIALSELTGIPVHIAHVSTRESVRVIREAKHRGIPVTAETAPHYFILTEEAVETIGANAKMNPPLRSRIDREAVRKGIGDGTIDVIASDHAPHADAEKAACFEEAPNGIVGMETSVSLTLKMVETGMMTMERLVEAMSSRPARILGLTRGIRKGAEANLTIIDPERIYRVDALEFQSLSRNTPFDGWKMKGKPVLTMVRGRIVYIDDCFDTRNNDLHQN